MFEGAGSGSRLVAGFGAAESLDPNELLGSAERAVAVQSRMEWERYTAAAQLHRLLVEPLEDTVVAMGAVDPFSVCAAQLAAAQQMTQQGAEYHLTRALALRDRLPCVNQVLKEGLVAGHHIAAIVSRTDLIEGSEHMAAIDREIAEQLRGRRGSWSKNQLRDMVDRTIYFRDPTLVRQNRADAKKKRGIWASNIGDGMSAIDAVGSAEETGLIMARLDKLAMSVCKADPRRKADRMADALFAVVMGRDYSCQCPKDPKHPCTAHIWTYPAGHLVSGVDVKLVLHVIADQGTVDGNADNPGHLEGHGVISGDHVRDVAARPETVQRRIGNEYELSEPDWGAADLAAEADYAEFYAAEQAATAEYAAEAAAAARQANAPGEPPESEPETEAAAEEQPEADAEAAADQTGVPGTENPTDEPEPEPKSESASEPEPEAGPEAEAATATEPRAPDKSSGPTRARVYSRAPDDLTLPDFAEMAAAAAAAPYWQPIPLPVIQPGDAYRPSAVLDTFLRIRDLYCMWPGCDKPAWTADLDHTREYNHDCPDAGGHTHPDEMKAFCRFHHLMKTGVFPL